MTPEWLAAFFAGLQVLIALTIGIPTLLYLKRYVEDTAALAKEARNQSEALVSPALVIDFKHDPNPGTVYIRNIGQHAAFDVQVKPFSTAREGSRYLHQFDRIPVIENGSRSHIDAHFEPVENSRFNEPLFRLASAYNAFEENPESTVTVECRSISNQRHVFTFMKKNAEVADDRFLYYFKHRYIVPANHQPMERTG